jgi:hypothetical protein
LDENFDEFISFMKAAKEADLGEKRESSGKTLGIGTRKKQ